MSNLTVQQAEDLVLGFLNGRRGKVTDILKELAGKLNGCQIETALRNLESGGRVGHDRNHYYYNLQQIDPGSNLARRIARQAELERKREYFRKHFPR